MLNGISTVIEVNETLDKSTKAVLVGALFETTQTITSASDMSHLLRLWSKSRNLQHVLRAPGRRSDADNGPHVAERFLHFICRLVTMNVTEPLALRQSNPHASVAFMDHLTEWITSSSGFIAQHWETQWTVKRKIAEKFLFDTEATLIAEMHRILQGFSISPDSLLAMTTASATGVDSEMNQQAAFLVGFDPVASRGLRHAVDVTLVKRGDVFPTIASSLLTLDEIKAAFNNGFTVGIRGVHARNMRVSTLCAQLQQRLGQHVNANVYCESIASDTTTHTY